MNRSPILMIILAGLLVLCLLSAVSLIRSGQARETSESGPPGGELGNAIPFTGQNTTETPEDSRTPSADQTPAAGETPSAGITTGEATQAATQPGDGPAATPRAQGAPTSAAQPAPANTLRPSRTPDPTNTRIPTFTRVPTRATTPTGAATSAATAASGPNAGAQDYRTSVNRQVEACNEGLVAFDEFARAVTADPTTLFAPDIRARLDETLEEINGTCGFLGSIDPVPTEYAVADQTLDRAAAAYRETTDAFTRGLDTLNPALLVEALDHLEAATTLATQAQSEMP